MKKIISIILFVCLGLAFVTGCTKEPKVTDELDSTFDTQSDTTELPDTTKTPDASYGSDEIWDEYITHSERIDANPDEWSDPKGMAPTIYAYATNLIFEEGDTVSVDSLIYYFILNEMYDSEAKDLYKHLKQYQTAPDSEGHSKRIEICIPKTIVNEAIEKHFAVKTDGSDSQFTHPEKEDCYLLQLAARDGISVAMKDYETTDGRSTAVYAIYDPIDKTISGKVELCIENEDSEEDFRIIYAREIEDPNEKRQEVIDNIIIWPSYWRPNMYSYIGNSFYIEAKKDTQNIGSITANINYPTLIHKNSKYDDVNTVIKDSIDEFLAKTAADIQDGSDVALNLNYVYMCGNDKFISLVFKGNTNSDSPYPSQIFFTLNFDLVNGKRLKAADIFRFNENFFGKFNESIEKECSKEEKEYIESLDMKKLLESADESISTVYTYYTHNEIHIVVSLPDDIGTCVDIAIGF